MVFWEGLEGPIEQGTNVERELDLNGTFALTSAVRLHVAVTICTGKHSNRSWVVPACRYELPLKIGLGPLRFPLVGLAGYAYINLPGFFREILPDPPPHPLFTAPLILTSNITRNATITFMDNLLKTPAHTLLFTVSLDGGFIHGESYPRSQLFQWGASFKWHNFSSVIDQPDTNPWKINIHPTRRGKTDMYGA